MTSITETMVIRIYNRLAECIVILEADVPSTEIGGLSVDVIGAVTRFMCTGAGVTVNGDPVSETTFRLLTVVARELLPPPESDIVCDGVIGVVFLLKAVEEYHHVITSHRLNANDGDGPSWETCSQYVERAEYHLTKAAEQWSASDD